jgi:hypothetical protein
MQATKKSRPHHERTPQQAKEVQYTIMDCILCEIEKAKGDQLMNAQIGTTERKVSYGISKSVIEKHKRANPWLYRDILNNYKQRKEKTERPVVSVAIGSKTDAISDLTDATINEATNACPPNVASVISEASTTEVLSKKIGKPQDVTKEAKRSDIQKMQQALNYAATESLSV